MVRTLNDRREENEGKCILDMDDILPAFNIIRSAMNNIKKVFFLTA